MWARILVLDYGFPHHLPTEFAVPVIYNRHPLRIPAGSDTELYNLWLMDDAGSIVRFSDRN
jgi:hypothetical protein